MLFTRRRYITLYHGSVADYRAILAKGFERREGATYVSEEIGAAENAIDPAFRADPLTDSGIITSRVLLDDFKKLLASGEITARPYSGFGGANLKLMECQLWTDAARDLFNKGIVR